MDRIKGVDATRVVDELRARVPLLLAVYAFGSRTGDRAGPESDLDLAVLVEGRADPMLLWDVSGDLADLVGCSVDLLDLRAATTIMQYQVVTRGERWWNQDVRAPLFEAAVLSEKTELDRARAGLMQDIASRGSVYGG